MQVGQTSAKSLTDRAQGFWVLSLQSKAVRWNLVKLSLLISYLFCTFVARLKREKELNSAENYPFKTITINQLFMTTNQQFDEIRVVCRDIFSKKLKDYGASWRILRQPSLTDQIFIKANRIRSIETTGVNRVGEDIRGELIAIVNYGIIGLIQLELGDATEDDLAYEKAMELYDHYFEKAKQLMIDKNHDYGEAWRLMRSQSYTDLILMKINRTKQIEDNLGKTLISEGIDANYYDMINYAIFGLIKIDFKE